MTTVHTPKQVSAERLREMLAIATTLHAATFPVPADTMRQVLTLALEALAAR